MIKFPVSVELYSLKELLKFIDRNHVEIPGFQRGYVWKHEQVVKFFESLKKHYPVGALIVWRTKNNKLQSRPLIDSLPTKSKERFYILDGQQRILSLLYLLRPKVFTQQKKDFEENYTENWKKMPKFEEYCVSEKSGRLLLKKNDSCLPERNESNFEKRLGDDYKIPVIFIEINASHRPDDEAIEIFNRINRAGTTISTDEIFFSKIWHHKLGLGPKLRRRKMEMIRHGKWVGRIFHDLDNTVFAHAFAAAFQVEIRDHNRAASLGGQEFKKNRRGDEIRIDSDTLGKIANVVVKFANKPSCLRIFQRTLRSVERAVVWLHDEIGICDVAELPSEKIVTLLALYFYFHDGGPGPETGRQLRRWFWCSILSRRHIRPGYAYNISEDIDVLTARRVRFLKNHFDYVDFEKLWEDTSISSGRAMIRDAVLLMLWSNKPIDLTSGRPYDKKNFYPMAKRSLDPNTSLLARPKPLKAGKEDDHFYPRRYQGGSPEVVDNILNLVLLDKNGNLNKSGKLPATWIAERLRAISPTGLRKKVERNFFRRNLLPFDDLRDMQRLQKKHGITNAENPYLVPHYIEYLRGWFFDERAWHFERRFRTLMSGKKCSPW